ncbi:PREDICTED: uncharacterized protein LOC105114932 [Populus euphratica]|uniref:Uncharacterized protein LOC105114932 n=1 Tax=Populus euphratica TaxID=75702 RepID=A0AAJ6TEQ4_POPEU|nr:PREDICTED: uncharacterized protein LOC105114932 [Populus euphratica]
MATGQAPGNPIPAMRKYPPVEHPVVVIGPQYLAQYPVELAVNSDFKVSDINSTLIFQVKIKLLSLNRRFLKDAAGNTVVNLRKKARTMHGRWEAFRGEGKEKQDLLFTAKKSKLFQSESELDVFLGNNEGEVPDFKVKEGDSKSSCSILLGDSNTMLARVHGRHTLAIMPNVDYAFIVALAVIILHGINANDHGDEAINVINGINGNPIPAVRTYPPVEHPVVVIGPQYLAQYPVELAVNSDFKVSDINGTLIFQVKSKILSLHDRRFLKDAAGNTLVNLRKKARTMHGRWEAFRGEGKEKQDLLFTAKKSKLFQSESELDVFLGNNEGEVPDFKVKERYSQSSCSILLGDSNTMLAQVHGRHTLAIMPNVDYAFIMALMAVIRDHINANDHGDTALNVLNGINGVLEGFASSG